MEELHQTAYRALRKSGEPVFEGEAPDTYHYGMAPPMDAEQIVALAVNKGLIPEIKGLPWQKGGRVL